MQENKRQVVPLIITADLEIAHDHDFSGQENILNIIRNDFEKIDLPSTFFLTQDFSERFGSELSKYNFNKTEFGIHGKDHSADENYRLLGMKSAELNINEAKDQIECLTGREVNCFRGTFMSTSVLTQKILVKYGIKSDYSVCSQRLDYFNSLGGDIRWIISPRFPYHPSDNNPYKKGSVPLWVIPLSCFGFPFISSLLYILGINFMKYLFRIFLWESLRTGKPVVYLFHSYEFTEDKINGEKISLEHRVSPLHRFYIKDIRKRYDLNMKLIAYMLSFPEVQPLNNSQYLAFMEGKGL